jgi:hypothetical protein
LEVCLFSSTKSNHSRSNCRRKILFSHRPRPTDLIQLHPEVSPFSSHQKANHSHPTSLQVSLCSRRWKPTTFIQLPWRFVFSHPHKLTISVHSIYFSFVVFSFGFI